MKKIVYLAPLALLGIGAKASADQVPTHISNALRVYEEQETNNQSQLASQPIGRVKEATHISRLDSDLIDKGSSVINKKASQIMKINRPAIPTKRELSESKESVAGQYVQVQQNRVAQFNNGSKIYGLNNSSQLSKNNGDGYVITNAGTYNGRPVDIAVTTNNVQDNQGTYTTKWSNGDSANVTGKTDASFKYQDSVLLNQQQDNVVVPNNTRPRTETQTKSVPYDYNFEIMSNYGSGGYHAFTDVTFDVIDYLEKNNNDLEDALQRVVDKHGSASVYEYWRMRGGATGLTNALNNADPWNGVSEVRDFSGGLAAPANRVLITGFSTTNDSGEQFFGLFGYKGSSEKPHMINKLISTDVTDHLQLASSTPASLGYNYTIGVYDAQTGELIKDLTANYKGKVGKIATDQDTAMNNAIKAKIQAINANNANAAYTGTAANNDVTFSKNTVHVNYVDEQGRPINVPGYDIDVDDLTNGNYQVPQNYILANTNGFKVTKNTHEVNGITVTDSYNFIDQGNNRVTDNGKTLSVVLAHGTTHVDPSHSGLSNNATNNTFVINNGAKRQINNQSRRFGASGVLDLVTNKVSMQGDWQLSGKPNFDQTNINNDLVGYGNAIHSNLTFLTL